jgi:hypothetical protein
MFTMYSDKIGPALISALGVDAVHSHRVAGSGERPALAIRQGWLERRWSELNARREVFFTILGGYSPQSGDWGNFDKWPVFRTERSAGKETLSQLGL